jgi:hypothetical protein
MRPIGYTHKLKRAVQSASVTYVSKASIVLYLSVAANNAFGFQLNPHQKLNKHSPKTEHHLHYHPSKQLRILAETPSN